MLREPGVSLLHLGPRNNGTFVLCLSPSRPVVLLCGSRNRTEPLTSTNFLRHFEDSTPAELLEDVSAGGTLPGTPRRILMAQRQIVVYRMNVNSVDVILHWENLRSTRANFEEAQHRLEFAQQLVVKSLDVNNFKYIVNLLQIL